MIMLGGSESIIRDIHEKSKLAIKKYGKDNVFDFSIGNPSIPAPKEVTSGPNEILNTEDPVKLHSYTSAIGDSEARNAIVSFLNKKYLLSESPDLVYLSMGASQGLTITLNALLNKGDEAIIFSPYFPEYKVYIEMVQGKAVEVETNKDFMIDLDLLDKCDIDCLEKGLFAGWPSSLSRRGRSPRRNDRRV